MTIREKLRRFMTDRGLWSHEADEILSKIESDESNKELTQVFNDVAEGYPKEFMAVAILVVSHDVVEWIDANCPKHFARMNFVF